MEPVICFLIDDDADDQVFFDIAWKKVDKTVECQFANDGISALKRINNNFAFIPHAIFIDINMPIMNGIRLLKEMKKIERFHAVPIYMYSTSSEERIVNECMGLGATGFIKKQADIKDLLNSFREILEGIRKNLP